MKDPGQTRDFTLVAAGDLLLPEVFPSDLALDPAVCRVMGHGDLTVANLEVPLTDRTESIGKFIAIRASPECVEMLLSLHVDVVSLANNHAIDQGYDGARDTAFLLGEMGIAFSGIGDTLALSVEPVIIRKAGVSVAFFSAASTLPLGFAALLNRPGVAPIRVKTSFEMGERLMENPGQSPVVRTEAEAEDVEYLANAVTAAREAADVIVVSLHWGVPQQPFLADYQTPLAHRLIEAGADVVLGHHPHVLHGIEFYQGRPILYSLGHLICDVQQVRPLLPELKGPVLVQWNLSAVARLSLEDGRWSVRLTPISIGEDGYPTAADEVDFGRVLETIGQASEDFDVAVTRVDEEIKIRPVRWN